MELVGVVTVCGHDVSIYDVDALEMPDALGMCDAGKCEIKISKGLKRSMKQSTLCHEILHFISDVTGAGLTERQVLAVEMGLSPIVKIKMKKV